MIIAEPQDPLHGPPVKNLCSRKESRGQKTLNFNFLHLQQIYAQLVCSFRYGKEEDETMGLNFKKELTLADEQVYPPPGQNSNLTRQIKNTLNYIRSKFLGCN